VIQIKTVAIDYLLVFALGIAVKILLCRGSAREIVTYSPT